MHGNYFDVVFMEGEVLHYFHDIDQFMNIMRMLLKEGGRLICSDFHPFTKIIDSLGLQQKTLDYFSYDNSYFTTHNLTTPYFVIRN